MIEITTAVVEKVQTLMHENAGFIMSKNVERILDDLAKQAEVFGVSMTSIPVTMKMTISVDDFGVHLTFDSVTWQKTMRASDKACYTVDYDPRQPNLPGFDQADQPEQPEKQQPVIDVKALPEHEDDANDAGGFDDELSELFKDCCPKDLRKNILQNLQKAGDEMIMIVVMPTLDDRHVVKYLDDVWSKELVPNEMKALEQLDDGEHIIFGLDGELTKTTKAKLLKKGYGILSVGRSLDGHLALMKAKDSGTFDVIFDVADDLDGRFNFFEKLAQMIKEDDALIMNEAEFYEYKAK